MSARGRAWVLVGLLSAACCVLAWSLGVLLSEDVDEPDYLWEPVDVLVEQQILWTALALAVVAVAAPAYTRLHRQGNALPEDVTVPLLMIGGVIGIGYSVVTAPTIGANIGGGLFLMFGPLAVLALAAVSIRAALRHRKPTPT